MTFLVGQRKKGRSPKGGPPSETLRPEKERLSESRQCLPNIDREVISGIPFVFITGYIRIFLKGASAMIQSGQFTTTRRDSLRNSKANADFMAAKAGLGLLLEQKACNETDTRDGLVQTDLFTTIQSPTESENNEKINKADESLNPDDSASVRLKQEMKLLEQDPAHKAKLLGLIHQNPTLSFETLSRFGGVTLSPEGLQCLAQRSIANRLLHEKDFKAEMRQQEQQRTNSTVPLADLLKLLAMESGTGQ